MKKVYYDVENTLEVPFITGIQRVVREFSKIVLSDNLPVSHHYIPVVYDYRHANWRRLTKFEHRSLLSSSPRSISLAARIVKRMSGTIPKARSLYLDGFEAGSIFLDIESSWHSSLQRAELLPQLKRSGVKLAKLHYDIIPILFPETTHPNTVTVFKKHLKAHLKSTDLFLCISNLTAGDVQRFCQQQSVRQPSLETIRLGASFENPISDTKSRKAQNFGKFLLSVGTIEPRKNYPILIEAFNVIQEQTDLNLVIVGKNGWLADDICAQISEHPNYGTRLHHLEQIPDSQLDALYRDAWLCVIPSLYEGYGLPVAESLARNCPTICSSSGSLEEIAGNHVKYFSPSSSEDLQTTIMDLFEDSNALDRLRQSARSYKPISWEETVADIDRHLSKMS